LSGLKGRQRDWGRRGKATRKKVKGGKERGQKMVRERVEKECHIFEVDGWQP